LAPVAYQAGAVAEVKAALDDGVAEALMELYGKPPTGI